ncbi:MAG: DNA repair protein RecO [Flavobacteriales bacterium]|nr:DNA repair protein RecO [Flavobacteriales bacterium]
MLSKTEGIVLHSIKQGERGRIVKIYTRTKGLIPFIVRSTQSKRKGDSSGLLMPLRVLDLEVDIREGRSLQTIRYMSAAENQFALYNSPLRSSIALFIAEAFVKSIEEEDNSESLYQTLLKWTRKLEKADALAEIPIRFLLELSEPLGFQPHAETQGPYFDLREGVFQDHPPHHPDFLDGEISSSLRAYLGTEIVATHAISKELRRRLLEGLVMYYRIHIPQFKGLSSFEVLREVYSL